MKVRDILTRDEKSNIVKAMRIVQRTKEKAKHANPGQDDTIVQGPAGDGMKFPKK